MPSMAPETVDPPYPAFRFEVALTPDEPVPGVDSPICNAAFAECDGLEMNMEPKVVREGGNNDAQQHLVGPLTYGQLTLRRGMTDNLQLWSWFQAATQPGQLKRPTASGEVTLWDAGGTPRVTFLLHECVPVKLRGPSLNARDGQVAIEELHLAYASMDVRAAGSGGFGLSAGISASASLSVSGGPGLTGGISAQASASFSLG